MSLPFLVHRLVRFRLLGAELRLQPLLPLAVGVTLYAACHLTHANPYLAAFSAGVVTVALAPEAKAAFEPLGEALAELAKFAALLVFGALLTPHLFGDLSIGGYAVAVLSIVLIRPASLLLSLAGTDFDRREKLTAAWFGPKGFASVVYGLLVLRGIPSGGGGVHADRRHHRLLHHRPQQHGRPDRPHLRRRGARRYPRRRQRDTGEDDFRGTE
ncbi:peptidase [Streptomyces badius]